MQTRRIALAAASVTVLQNGRPVLVGGRTDEGGEYSVRLPAGKYEVSVSALRYERKQAVANLTRGPVNLEIVLNPENETPRTPSTPR